MKYIKVGNIIEIDWTDVQALDRINCDNIDNLVDPLPTRTWGMIVKILPKSLVLAHEMSEPSSDGCFVSVYPLKLIDDIKLLGKRK
jgi:hypothetical protein